nr:hypothetical protein [uncultured Blautia sp.]
MFECQKYQNILGEKTVKIKTTVKDWDRLLKTNLWNEVEQILCDNEETTGEGPRTITETNYQDMTESEKNEIIAYAAGTLQSIHKEINNVQSFLLTTSVAKICILLAILIAILLHR